MGKLKTGLVAALAAALSCLPAAAAQAKESLVQHCASVGDDDEVRGYDPSLENQTIAAHKALFPDARGEPDPSEFPTQANYRCMGGKPFVCFVGANLPCAKINTARDNPGANAECKSAKDGASVSAAATGHDSAYAYTCKGGKAEVSGETWTLDKRGFAKEIWTPLPSN